MEEVKYEFDDEFQTCVASLLIRDVDFCIRTDGLIRPEYLSNELEGSLVAIWQDHFVKYRRLPDNPGVIKEVIKDGIAKKRIRKDLLPEVSAKLKELGSVVIADRDFILDKCVEFAKHQALTQAIFASVDLIERKRFEDVEKLVRRANEVGADDTLGVYDYYDESLGRKSLRDDLVAGKVVHDGIPTGIDVLDKLLYHKGWGRKELTVIMGGAKSGKTTMMIDTARAAALFGRNVLYVSLEVASKIIAERLDANIAEIPYSELHLRASEVHEKVSHMMKTSGAFKIHEFPSGSMTPQMLNRLINRYKSMGTIFDLVVLDYADLMIPNNRMNDAIENSKRIYVDLRGIAQEHNLALLTGTQTNREGMKAAVAKMTDIADDINKARTCDLLLSINATDDERTRKEARLYFAASRNQAGDRTIKIKQDLERGKFISRVLSVD